MEIIENVLLPVSLWFIMYSMGLSLTLSDFGRVFSNRRALIIGCISMLIILPLIGITISIIAAPTPALAVGFVLLATCPGGMLSNLLTDIAKGDLALSLSLSLVVSILYILLVPFYAHMAITHFMGISETINVPIIESFWRIISITLIPVALGLTTRSYKPTWAIRCKPYIKNIATTILTIAFGFIIYDQIETLRRTLGTIFFMVLTMNIIALAMAYLLCNVSRLLPDERKAVCIEHLIRQEGTAIYIAVTIIGVREMALPMIINTPVALVICIAFVCYLRMSKPRTSEAEKIAA